jgi:polyisoprenoid-binding protein YceI
MSPLATRQINGLELPAPGVFTLDKAHTQIGFIARHLMVTKVRGRFADFEGTITFADDLAASTVDVTVQMASISTNDEGRDTHLRSSDFFEIDTYPTMHFVSTALRETGRGKWTLVGDLTIKGVTRPIELDVTYEGVTTDPWGGERVGFTAQGEVNREDWGLTWNVALDNGGMLVSRAIKIELEVEAVRQEG